MRVFLAASTIFVVVSASTLHNHHETSEGQTANSRNEGGSEGGKKNYWWSGVNNPFKEKCSPGTKDCGRVSSSGSGTLNQNRPVHSGGDSNAFPQTSASQQPHLHLIDLGVCPTKWACIHWQLCRNGYILADGTGKIDKSIRMPEKFLHYDSCGEDMVCCEITQDSNLEGCKSDSHTNKLTSFSTASDTQFKPFQENPTPSHTSHHSSNLPTHKESESQFGIGAQDTRHPTSQQGTNFENKGPDHGHPNKFRPPNADFAPPHSPLGSSNLPVNKESDFGTGIQAIGQPPQIQHGTNFESHDPDRGSPNQFRPPQIDLVPPQDDLALPQADLTLPHTSHHSSNLPAHKEFETGTQHTKHPTSPQVTKFESQDLDHRHPNKFKPHQDNPAPAQTLHKESDFQFGTGHQDTKHPTSQQGINFGGDDKEGSGDFRPNQENFRPPHTSHHSSRLPSHKEPEFSGAPGNKDKDFQPEGSSQFQTETLNSNRPSHHSQNAPTYETGATDTQAIENQPNNIQGQHSFDSANTFGINTATGGRPHSGNSGGGRPHSGNIGGGYELRPPVELYGVPVREFNQQGRPSGSSVHTHRTPQRPHTTGFRQPTSHSSTQTGTDFSPEHPVSQQGRPGGALIHTHPTPQRPGNQINTQHVDRGTLDYPGGIKQPERPHRPLTTNTHHQHSVTPNRQQGTHRQTTSHSTTQTGLDFSPEHPVSQQGRPGGASMQTHRIPQRPGNQINAQHIDRGTHDYSGGIKQPERPHRPLTTNTHHQHRVTPNRQQGTHRQTTSHSSTQTGLDFSPEYPVSQQGRPGGALIQTHRIPQRPGNQINAQHIDRETHDYSGGIKQPGRPHRPITTTNIHHQHRVTPNRQQTHNVNLPNHHQQGSRVTTGGGVAPNRPRPGGNMGGGMMGGMMMMPMLVDGFLMMAGSPMKTFQGTPLNMRDCSAGTFCLSIEECDPYTGFIIMEGTTPPPAPFANAPTVEFMNCTGESGNEELVCCRLPHPLIGPDGKPID